MTNTQDTVRLEVQGHIATLRLNRPDKLNALTDDMVRHMLRLLDEVTEGPARVLIVTGEGRGFCAGFDLSLAEKAEGEGDETAAWMARQERYASLVTRLRAIPQPTIAAVNGAACGAGFGLALACDLRIAGPGAKFNAAFIKVGMSSCDIGVSYLLPRAIGTTRAFEIMLTGRMVGAEEAERIGLVSALHADGLDEQAENLAHQIAENGGLSTWMTKRGMWANLEAGSLSAALELENRTQILMRGTGSLAARAVERGFLKP
ncbi:enoyl-CoA hydratase/isomerase family protein [Pontitalea aquivivens]|uniref:enoyl-CoA hydratase/isomerase family protein n=1 Tax=Pontitalea aquivivens TaxID=3388663 RepID=UPI0039710998